MTSRERLLAVLRGERPDRIPVTVYEFTTYVNDWASETPSYAPLLELEREFGDSFVYAPIDCPVFLGDPNAIHGNEEKHADGTVVKTVEIDTPKGRLRSVTRRDPEMMTNWQVEPLIKSDEDIQRVLVMEAPPAEVDVARIRDLETRVGENGVMLYSVGDAIGHVVGLFDFEDFALRCYEDDGPIRALLARAQELVLRGIRAIGTHVTDATFRLWGPEYCGAPLMNPHVYFRRYVVEQDREATEAIHATGNYSIIHCHGKLRDILEMIAETGADALEPLELLPLPTADVTREELAEVLGGRMCLMGGVQARTLETGTPAEVREEVRRGIEILGATGRYVVLPTAAPFMVPLDPKCLENLRVMYEAAHTCGAMG